MMFPQFNAYMKLCLLAVGLLFVVCAHAVPVTSPRIIGGTVVSADVYPWLVNLQFDGDFICGGSLVSDKWVLTAAHCVTDGTADRYTVRVGVQDLSSASQGETRTVDKIIVHPDFSYDTLANDIALVGFSTPVTAKPVTLLTSAEFSRLITGQNFAVAGWGATNTSGSMYPSILQRAMVPLVDHAQCAASYAAGDITITDKMVCAGGGATDSCFGDSGGPLFQQTDEAAEAKQVGVVSFGASEKCADGFPGIYTRVDAYADFIAAATQGWIESVDLGAVENNDSITQRITFTNQSSAAVTFTGVVEDFDGVVSLTDNTCLNITLAVGDSCSFSLTAKPTTVGDLAGNITFTSADDKQLTYHVKAQITLPPLHATSSGALDSVSCMILLVVGLCRKRLMQRKII